MSRASKKTEFSREPLFTRKDVMQLLVIIAVAAILGMAITTRTSPTAFAAFPW